MCQTSFIPCFFADRNIFEQKYTFTTSNNEIWCIQLGMAVSNSILDEACNIKTADAQNLQIPYFVSKFWSLISRLGCQSSAFVAKTWPHIYIFCGQKLATNLQMLWPTFGLCCKNLATNPEIVWPFCHKSHDCVTRFWSLMQTLCLCGKFVATNRKI